MDIEEVQQKLGEYLASDFEHGPFSDTSFARAEVEPDGMVSLFASESESAWPVASFDAPQLAEWLMPLVRRAQAEAEKAVLVKVAENAEELQHAREEVRERIYNGYSVDWSDGYDAACGDIAKWARRLIENEGAGA